MNISPLNDRVLVPAGHPRTRHLLEKAGFETVALDVSEFRKLDGGLSCLSIRFGRQGMAGGSFRGPGPFREQGTLTGFSSYYIH